MTITEVRETLAEVAEAVDVPPCDVLAFHRAVRAQRRARVGSRLAGLGVAAASIAAVAAVVWQQAGTSGQADQAPAAPNHSVGVAPGRISEPAYYVQGGRLVALDPEGHRHDLGLPSEGVVGATAEGVVALDRDSHVVRFAAHFDSDADPGKEWTFSRAGSPVQGPVVSIAMSGDGRWLAWRDLADHLTTYDQKAGTRSTRDLDDDGSVVAVSGVGVLMSTGDGLTINSRDASTEVVLPARWTGDVSASQQDLISTTDEQNGTSIYRVNAASGLERLDDVEGTGVLAPDGNSMASVRTTPDDRTTVWLWTPDRQRQLTGLHGTADSVAWQDERTVLVTTGEQLWSCQTETATCGLLRTGGTGTITLPR